MSNFAETTVCHSCGERFKKRRQNNQYKYVGVSFKEAKYCSSPCRQSAYRNRKEKQKDKRKQLVRALVTGARDFGSGTTLLAAVTRPVEHVETKGEILTKKTTEHLSVVPDELWPGMWRVRFPNGTLSDMVNLTRANDVVRLLTEMKKNV